LSLTIKNKDTRQIKKNILSVAVVSIFSTLIYLNIAAYTSTPISASETILANSATASNITDESVLDSQSLLNTSLTPIQGLDAVESDTSVKIRDIYADPVKVGKLERYLRRRGSPLADHAEVLVMKADEYGIDYRLVASISIIESSG